MEVLLDTNTVSLLLGCSPATVARYCQSGELPFVLVNKGRRKSTRKFKPSAVNAFVMSRSSVLQSSVNEQEVGFLPPPVSSDFQPAGFVSLEQLCAPPPPVQEALREAEADLIEVEITKVKEAEADKTEPATEPATTTDAATVEPEATYDTERLNVADMANALA